MVDASRWHIQRAGAGYRRRTAAAPPRYLPRGCADSPRPRGVTLARFCAASPTPLRVTARFVQIWALFGGSGGLLPETATLKIMPASIARRIGAGA